MELLQLQKMFEIYERMPKDIEDGTMIIGTHNNWFHADDVVASVLLSLTEKYKKSIVVRTRYPELLKQCDCLVDVGGVYDPEMDLFDHHQKTFDETFPGQEIRMSSSGIVYLKYGKEIIKTLTKEEDEKKINILFNKLYSNFLIEICGIDNGVNPSEGKINYVIRTGLSSRISECNPDTESDFPDYCSGFQRAMVKAKTQLLKKLDILVKWMSLRRVIEEAIDKRFEVHESGKIISLKSCQFDEHLQEIEKEKGIEGEILFAIQPEKNASCFRIYTVRKGEGSFQHRKGLLHGGLSEKETCEKYGFEGCTFVHVKCFTGAHKTKEGALKMAVISLE
jgi:uncharacterized UPF0160 family protein